MSETAYENFLRSKVVSAPERGIAIDPGAIHPWLKPHAKAIVRRQMATPSLFDLLAEPEVEEVSA